MLGLLNGGQAVPRQLLTTCTTTSESRTTQHRSEQRNGPGAIAPGPFSRTHTSDSWFPRKKHMTPDPTDMTPDPTESAPGHPPNSSPAQAVTTGTAAVLAVALVGLGVAGAASIDALGNRIDSVTATSSPSALREWLCLPYTQFVLEQHRAGLTSHQIAAALEASEYGRVGQRGATAPVANFVEPRLDSMVACGFPSEVIEATNPGATP